MHPLLHSGAVPETLLSGGSLLISELNLCMASLHLFVLVPAFSVSSNSSSASLPFPRFDVLRGRVHPCHSSRYSPSNQPNSPFRRVSCPASGCPGSFPPSPPGTTAPSLGARAGAAHGERPLPARPCASQVRLELRARKSQRGESERFPVKNKTKQNNPNNTANLGT